MPPGLKRRISYSNDRKVDVILWYDRNGKNAESAARHFQIPVSSIREWLKNREVVLEQGSAPSVKRNRPLQFPSVDEALLTWFKQQRSLFPSESIDQNLLLEKAQEIAKEQDHADLPSLNLDWIKRFKKRYGISSKVKHGESGAVQNSAVEDWQANSLKRILESYDSKDIFNVDELGLFYKLTSNRTLAFSDEKCAGGKASKERLTVLLGASMTGEKLPMLVIGKSANPRCFKHVRCLPVAYEANKKAWMNGSLFEQYVRKLNMRMRAKKRSIALIVDNCPAHPNLTKFANVKLFFLPPNTTAKTQPMDAGVIRNFKLHYRTQFRKERLAALSSQASFQFTVLDALRVAKFAWDCVKVSTIVNCFTHCGFTHDEAGQTELLEDISDDLVALDNILASTYQYVNEDTFSAASYLAVDDDIVTAAPLSLAEISHNAISSADSVLNLSDGDEMPDDEPVAPPPLKDSYSLLSQLRQMVGAYAKSEAQASEMSTHLIQLSNAFTDLSQSAAKQTSITDFFTANAN